MSTVLTPQQLLPTRNLRLETNARLTPHGLKSNGKEKYQAASGLLRNAHLRESFREAGIT